MSELDELRALANGNSNSEMDELRSLANKDSELEELRGLANGTLTPQAAAAQGVDYSKVLPKLGNQSVKDAGAALSSMSQENKIAYAPKVMAAMATRNKIIEDIRNTGQVLGINDAPQMAQELLGKTASSVQAKAQPVLDKAQPLIEGGKTIAHGINRLLRAPKEYTTHNLYTPYTKADKAAGVEQGIDFPLLGPRRAAQLPFTEGINHPVSEEEWNKRLTEKHPVAYGGAMDLIDRGAITALAPNLAQPLVAKELSGKPSPLGGAVGRFITNNALDPTTYIGLGGTLPAKIARQVERASRASVGVQRAKELGKLVQPLMKEFGTPAFTEKLVAGLTKEGVSINDVIKVFGEGGEYIGKTGPRLSLPGEILGLKTPGVDLTQLVGKVNDTEHPIAEAAQSVLGSRFKLSGYPEMTLSAQLAKDRQLEEVLKEKYLKKAQAIQKFEALIPEHRRTELIENAIDPGDNPILGPLMKHEQQWVRGVAGITRGLRNEAISHGAIVPHNKNPISGMYWHRMYEPKAAGKIMDKVVGKEVFDSPLMGRIGGSGRAVGKGESDYFDISLDPAKVLPDYINKLSRTAANARSQRFAIEQFGKPAGPEGLAKEVGLQATKVLEAPLTKAAAKAIRKQHRINVYNANPLAPPDKLTEALKSSTSRAALKKAKLQAKQVEVPANIYNMLQRNASRGSGKLAPLVENSNWMKQHPLPAEVAHIGAKGVDYLNSAFKKAALMSPAHHLGNFIEDTTKLGVSGVNPLRPLSHLGDIKNKTPLYREAKEAGVPLGNLGYFDLANNPEKALKFSLKQQRAKAGMPTYYPGKLAQMLPNAALNDLTDAGNAASLAVMPLQKGMYRLTKASEKVASNWNDASRLGAYSSAKASGLGPTASAAESSKALFDYGDVTTRGVGGAVGALRQVMPFGNYNVRSAIDAPLKALEHPGRVRNVYRMYENDEQQLEPPEYYKDLGVSTTLGKRGQGARGWIREKLGGRPSQHDAGLSMNYIPRDQWHTAGNWATLKGMGQSLAPPLTAVNDLLTGVNSFTGEDQDQGISGIFPNRLRSKLPKDWDPGPDSFLFNKTGQATALQYAAPYIPRPITAPLDYLLTSDPAMTPIFQPDQGISDFPLDKRAKRLGGFFGDVGTVEYPGLAQKLLNDMYNEEARRIAGESKSGPGKKLLNSEKKLRRP